MGPIGVTDIRTFIDPSDPTRVAVTADVPDLEALTALMQSPEGAAATDYDGVLPETVVFFVEA
jgi:hypothetical protein